MNTNKTIIVTGRAGFIGSELIRYLIEKGYIDRQQLIDLALPLSKNQYGQYLLRISKGLT